MRDSRTGLQVAATVADTTEGAAASFRALAPGALLVQPGRRSLEIRADGYRPLRPAVGLEPGERLDLTVWLDPVAPEIEARLQPGPGRRSSRV